jgi:competence ComEA-like helix-hairpin-helix protein
MYCASLETGEKQQRDGRLTIVLLLVYSLLFYLLGHQRIFNGNDNQHIYIQLEETPKKMLYLEQGENIILQPKSMPLSYYPFFFLPLPINRADKELLMTIKGVGPSLAESIVTHRQKVGQLVTLRDLQKIPGVGEKRATALATDLVFDKAE